VSRDLGPSSAAPKGYGGCSVKNKATRILADAPRAILPHMRQSFIDRDQSELEIILGELKRMELIVKKEPLSDGDE
jgi:hypothetical protein